MIDLTNLPRWCYASASKKIITNAGSAITFTEGLDKDTNPPTAAEFRMDGPRFKEISKGYWEVWIAINVFISVTMKDDDFHDKYRLFGTIAQALNTTIPVFKFGDGIDDDREVQVGCFNLIQDSFNHIQVNYFGQIEKVIRVEQGTVEAHYRMYLTEN